MTPAERCVIKRRPSGPVLPGHVAEARRRLVGRAALSDEELARALWTARALPVALDVLSDIRASRGLTRARLGAPEVLARPCEAGPLVALGWMNEAGAELQVRFVREHDVGTPSLAIVVWHLSPKVVDDDATPVIHRFVHGPRR